MVTRVHSRLRDIGLFTINRVDAGQPRIFRFVGFEEQVLQISERNPRSSTRTDLQIHTTLTLEHVQFGVTAWGRTEPFSYAKGPFSA